MKSLEERITTFVNSHSPINHKSYRLELDMLHKDVRHDAIFFKEFKKVYKTKATVRDIYDFIESSPIVIKTLTTSDVLFKIDRIAQEIDDYREKLNTQSRLAEIELTGDIDFNELEEHINVCKGLKIAIRDLECTIINLIYVSNEK